MEGLKTLDSPSYKDFDIACESRLDLLWNNAIISQAL